MNVIYFSSAITDKSVKGLIGDINKYKDDVTVYFDSYGGSSSAARVFIDYTQKTAVKITLIANGELQSAGFMMFYLSDTKKEVLVGKTTMIHKSAYPKKEWFYALRHGIIKEHKETLHSIDYNVMQCLIDLKIGSEKIAKYNKHKDVYFTHEESDIIAKRAQKLYYTKGVANG